MKVLRSGLTRHRSGVLQTQASSGRNIDPAGSQLYETGYRFGASNNVPLAA
jgi:hypothetical protein